MKKKYFLILLVLLLASRFLLVSKHPGDSDPSIYILELHAMTNPSGNITHYFNQELSFGFYSLLKIIGRIVQHDISKLVVTLNYLNAVFGVLLILIFGLIAKRLAGSEVSLLGMSILLLDHSLWNWSLYGHPGIWSVALYLLSLYLFDKAIWKGASPDRPSEENGAIHNLYLFMSWLLALASLVIRADIFFVFGAYALLYIYRGSDKKGWKRLFYFYGTAFFSFLLLLYISAGYQVINIIIIRYFKPYRGEMTLFRILTEALNSLIKNVGLFSAGMGILFVAAAIVSMYFWIKKSPKFLPFLILAIFPLFIVAVRKGSDFARISILLHPILALFAALFFREIFSSKKFFRKKKELWGIAGIIVIYIIQTALVYYPLKKLWSLQYPPQPSIPFVVRPVPVGNFFTDRKNRWEDEKRLYQHALYLSKQKGKILVICSRLHFYRLAVLLLQVCPDATQPRSRRDLIYTRTTTYRLISRDHDHKDHLPELFASGLYHGYSVYFMNDIQHGYPEVPLPLGYKLLR